MGPGNGNGWANINALGHQGLVHIPDQRSKGVEGNNLLGVGPAGVGTNGQGGSGIGKVRPMLRIQHPTGHRQGTIHRVGARVSANRIAVVGVGHRGHDRPALEGVTVAPLHRPALQPRSTRVRGEYDVATLGRLGPTQAIGLCHILQG